MFFHAVLAHTGSDANNFQGITDRCMSGKLRKTCKCALCTVDDASCFLTIRLGTKTSVYHVKVIVVSTASGCDVTYCATLQRINKQIVLRL